MMLLHPLNNANFGEPQRASAAQCQTDARPVWLFRICRGSSLLSSGSERERDAQNKGENRTDDEGWGEGFHRGLLTCTKRTQQSSRAQLNGKKVSRFRQRHS